MIIIITPRTPRGGLKLGGAGEVPRGPLSLYNNENRLKTMFSTSRKQSKQQHLHLKELQNFVSKLVI